MSQGKVVGKHCEMDVLRRRNAISTSSPQSVQPSQTQTK